MYVRMCVYGMYGKGLILCVLGNMFVCVSVT